MSTADFGRWSAAAAPLYAPPVGTPAGRAEPPGRSLQPTWRATLFAAATGCLWLVVATDQWGSARALFWIDVALGITSMVVLQFRRRWPLGTAVLTSVTTAASASAIGAWVVCLASLATRRQWREILPTAVLATATGQVLYEMEPTQTLPWYANLIFTALTTAAVVAVGMYVGARRDLLDSLRDRAERAEREQALQVAAGRANERTRIAREMHDVLAHRMSLVAVHAGALAYRTDLGPAQIRETADIIRANSQRALADLREILGLLRDTEQDVDAAGHRPQPTLDDLGTLLEEERAAGARITLRSDLDDLDELPASMGRSAYRIVQESLTNARKHAPHAAVTVELTGRPGNGLDVCVRNPVRVGGQDVSTDGAGFGLIGLAERAAASHGRFHHGLTADGDFTIRAWLPWDR
jgi:signal transduction histidine kinase